MKKLSKINFKDARVLSDPEMKKIEGGTSIAEYCATLEMLWNNNANNWSVGAIEGWWYGWSSYCM